MRVDDGIADDGAVDEDEQDPDAVVCKGRLRNLDEDENNHHSLQRGPEPGLGPTKCMMINPQTLRSDRSRICLLFPPTAL